MLKHEKQSTDIEGFSLNPLSYPPFLPFPFRYFLFLFPLLPILSIPINPGRGSRGVL